MLQEPTHKTEDLRPVHTEEIVKDYSPKTRKCNEILVKSFENCSFQTIFKGCRFTEDFMVLTYFILSEACSILQSFLYKSGLLAGLPKDFIIFTFQSQTFSQTFSNLLKKTGFSKILRLERYYLRFLMFPCLKALLKTLVFHSLLCVNRTLILHCSLSLDPIFFSSGNDGPIMTATLGLASKPARLLKYCENNVI